MSTPTLSRLTIGRKSCCCKVVNATRVPIEMAMRPPSLVSPVTQ